MKPRDSGGTGWLEKLEILAVLSHVDFIKDNSHFTHYTYVWRRPSELQPASCSIGFLYPHPTLWQKQSLLWGMCSNSWSHGQCTHLHFLHSDKIALLSCSPGSHLWFSGLGNTLWGLLQSVPGLKGKAWQCSDNLERRSWDPAPSKFFPFCFSCYDLMSLD